MLLLKGTIIKERVYLRDHSNGIADVALDLRDEKKKLLNAVLDNLYNQIAMKSFDLPGHTVVIYSFEYVFGTILCNM